MSDNLPYRRILILGCCGSGKSTLSRRLAQMTGLPLIHLDKEYWNPGWVETLREEFRKRVEELVAGDEWIMDGNFSNSLDIRLPRCDCVVLLDYSCAVCVWGVIKRVASSLGRVRPDMGEGCPEKVDFAFLRFVWNFKKKSLPRIRERLDQFPDKRVIVLKSRRETETWLEKGEFSL